MTTSEVQVIVIGAGLSGLRAAKELHDAGLSYVVIEAMERVGGKTLSMPTKDDGKARVDLGAAWINDTTQTEMHSMAEAFGLGLEEQRTKGISVYQDSLGQLSSGPYGMESDLTPDQAREMENVMAKLMKFIEGCNPEDPRQGADAAKLDSMTVMELAEDVFGGSEVAHLFLATMTGSFFGADPDAMSALQLVDYIKNATGLTNILSETKDGTQYLHIKQGCQAFATNLAAQLNQGSIKLSSPAKLISQSDQGCVVETCDGTIYRGAKVILSIPTPLYHSVTFQPDLPHAKAVLRESAKYGYYAKTVLVFPFPWWREIGLSGSLHSEEGPIRFARDTSAPEEGQYSITCFHVAGTGRAWSELPADERQKTVLEHYRTLFSGAAKDVPEPIQVLEKEWSKDPFALGVGTPVMMPGIMTGDAYRALRDPFGHIHFVGTETAIAWKGFMEGAVRAGSRGAREVIWAIKST
ncbi:FAD/NAD(P)-binding domain-containing protein [Aspergillus tamarii]|uniref:Amine oxidase n=2 Tax=Aspergillus subgen. Circumdati TaxID=2720871 RepID=A0A5N6UKS2_ASPTM|nr:FAD/NAD(P)-binding domain-containing protein [Aspergillus tamarii]KAE8423644.1 FAD/NAD(P)-binding domain-containing protein [Aspergillus pseudocaelatus]